MTEPTPRPWHTGSDCVIRDHNGDRIAILGGGNADADSALIVRAVNSFDALVAACRSAEASLQTADKELGGGYFARAADYIKAALKLAEAP